MAEVLRIVLDNFWSWAGAFLLVLAAAYGLQGLIHVNVFRK